ncbi:hypothetical protein GCM10027343_16020 [Noviherbaspirillum agri]
MRKLFTVLAAMLIGWGNACADDKAAQPRIDELMHKSGLWRQIEQIEPLLQANLAQELGDASEEEESELWPLRMAMAKAYAAESLRAEVRNQLSLSLRGRDIDTVLAWLSTDLGQRFTALEEKSGELSEYEERHETAEQVMQSLPSQRIQLIRRFAKAIRIGEASASMAINTTVGITHGASLVSPHMTASEVKEIKRMLDEHRDGLTQMYEEQSVMQYAAIYQSVSDQDLKKYIAFAESPAGRRYHAATIKAMDIALTKAATEMGREIGTPAKSTSIGAGELRLGFSLPATGLALA